MPDFGLTPRQVRIALDLLAALVIVSVAFALAGLTWRLAGHAGTGAITVPSGASAPSAAPDIAPAVALAPFGKAPAGDASQPTTLALRLMGVIAAVPAELSTAFISVDGAPAAPFHLGENAGGGRIEGILRDRVLLSNAGRIEYLAFPDPAQPAAPPGGSSQPPVQPGSTPPRAAPPPPNPAPPAANPAAALIARLDATPAGKGYRIGQNAPAGLQPGDVVQSVNGAVLSDRQAAQAAFTAAAQSGSVQITILRDGRPITLTVPTR
jgi:general secretion pathway protein C